MLKKLRAMIKGRKERDKKNKDKIGKNFRKATKAGKRFGDDDRGSAKEKGVGGAGAVVVSGVGLAGAFGLATVLQATRGDESETREKDA